MLTAGKSRHYFKNKFMKKIFILIVSVIIMGAFNGCAPTMSMFDQTAYTNTTALKIDVLDLMDSATRPYLSQVNNIRTVNKGLLKLYEYNRNRPKNQITNAQFHVLMDSTDKGHLYISFLRLWQKKSVLDTLYINAKKQQISQTFDYISGLESKKIKQ
jgi:hypothetical protein